MKEYAPPKNGSPRQLVTCDPVGLGGVVPDTWPRKSMTWAMEVEGDVPCIWSAKSPPAQAMRHGEPRKAVISLNQGNFPSTCALK